MEKLKVGDRVKTKCEYIGIPKGVSGVISGITNGYYEVIIAKGLSDNDDYGWMYLPHEVEKDSETTTESQNKQILMYLLTGATIKRKSIRERLKVGDWVILNNSEGKLKTKVFSISSNKKHFSTDDGLYFLTSRIKEIVDFNKLRDIEESKATVEAQNKRILKYLQSGATVNPLSSLDLFGSFRLAARIHDLKGQGHNIKTTMVYNGKKKWANYNLIK